MTINQKNDFLTFYKAENKEKKFENLKIMMKIVIPSLRLHSRLANGSNSLVRVTTEIVYHTGVLTADVESK